MNNRQVSGVTQAKASTERFYGKGGSSHSGGDNWEAGEPHRALGSSKPVNPQGLELWVRGQISRLATPGLVIDISRFPSVLQSWRQITVAHTTAQAVIKLSLL